MKNVKIIVNNCIIKYCQQLHYKALSTTACVRLLSPPLLRSEDSWLLPFSSSKILSMLSDVVLVHLLSVRFSLLCRLLLKLPKLTSLMKMKFSLKDTSGTFWTIFQWQLCFQYWFQYLRNGIDRVCSWCRYSIDIVFGGLIKFRIIFI